MNNLIQIWTDELVTYTIQDITHDFCSIPLQTHVEHNRHNMTRADKINKLLITNCLKLLTVNAKTYGGGFFFVQNIYRVTVTSYMLRDMRWLECDSSHVMINHYLY